MDTEEKLYLKDKFAGILFTDKYTREFTESVVAASLGIPKSIVKDNLVLLTPRATARVHKQNSVVDALYENNTSIINIEINYTKYKLMDVKNLKYICCLIINQTDINELKSDLKPIYQICINNFDIFQKGKFMYKSYLMEENLHERRDDFISIIDINVDFLREMDYTEIMKKDEDSLERLLYIFVCNDKEVLDKLYKGDDIMAKVRKKLSALTKNFAEDLYYDKQAIINAYSFDLGKEQGIEEGVKQGIEEGKIEIAKSMLEDNMLVDVIIKHTGLTKEELDKLK